MATERYNFIYTDLVQSDVDLLGMIAYALYKRQKIEFIQGWRDRLGDDPSEVDRQHFHEISNSRYQLETYRNQAGELAEDFLNTSLEERAQELEHRLAVQATDELRRYKPNYWTGVSQGVVASAISVLLLGLLVMFTWSLNQGPRHVIEQVFNVKIIDLQSASDGPLAL
ncbi:hypothetical protein [Pseudomonas sp. UFMG81]|uniref:hypothetical protein n=1 Tax=Pseudomonas sp. UFMG81 TaxID=2745936 RepID=UPI00188E4FF9|nr:hypothetical protein [Pseudomonas sp. UFMG81]